jgi:AraC-like DNA-binding protein
MDQLKLTLLISSFVIPLILGITLILTSKNNFPKLVMGFALFNAFFVFLANYFYFLKLYDTYSYLHSFHIATVLWLFPSIYLYVKSLTSEQLKFKRSLFHLLPGLIFGLVSAILFYGMLDHEQRIFYLSNYRSGMHFSTMELNAFKYFRSTDVALIILQVIYYSIVLVRINHQYQTRLFDEYSNVEHLSINWIKWFDVAFVCVGILAILFYIFNPLHEQNEFFLVFFLFSISVFMWIIGLWSFKQKKPVFNSLLHQPGNPNIKSTKTNIGNEELAEKLIQYFEQEKPYLDSNLSLSSICKEIGTNRTYLSTIINTNFGMNFNAFVNQYRTRYIKKYLKNHPRTSIDDLVQIGGFGSKSSLKRALKKVG